jgi:hypothetical protein
MNPPSGSLITPSLIQNPGEFFGYKVDHADEVGD